MSSAAAPCSSRAAYRPPATWNVTGQPALALPVDRSADGLPVAVQLIGRRAADALLLALAAQLEHVLGVWRDTPDVPGPPTG